MKFNSKWQIQMAALVAFLGLSFSCTRDISVPVSPSFTQSTPTATPTNTGTSTFTFTQTFTTTLTSTNTFTFTFTPTPTDTPTFTFTNVGGFTDTFTNTPTVTDTPTNTGTFTFTGTPTFTFTATNTPTPTDTATATPTNTVDPRIIDDFENGATNANIYPGPGGTWDGSWFTVTDGSVNIYPAAMTWANAAGGFGGGNAAHVTISGSVTQSASFAFNFAATQTASSEVDLSAYTGVIFDMKADASYPSAGNYMNVAFPDSDTVAIGGVCTQCYDYHSAKVCLSTSWTPVTVFFSQLSQIGWGNPQVAFKPASIYGMAFSFPVSQNPGGMGVWVDNVQLTTAAPPAALSANYLSDFEFNSGGTNVNPNLTNYIAGSTGFQTQIDTTAPIDGVMMSPFVICGSGHNSNYSAGVSCNWNDPGPGPNPPCSVAGYCIYPSAQLQMFLMPTPSGGVTTYYHLPTGLTGIRFDWNVVTNSSTASPAGIYIHYNNGNYEGMSGFGQCNSGCWDDFTSALPSTAGSGWSTQSIDFGSFAEGYGSAPSPADSCQPGGEVAGAFPYAGGCYNNTTIGFSWAAQSGNVAGNYTTYFEVDNVTFY